MTYTIESNGSSRYRVRDENGIMISVFATKKAAEGAIKRLLKSGQISR